MNFRDRQFALRSTIRQVTRGVAMAPIFAGIYYLAYWLRFDGVIRAEEAIVFYDTLLCVLLTKGIVFGWFRIYQGWGRYVTFSELVALARATTCSAFLLVLFDYLILTQSNVPRSVFLMDWGGTIVIIGGARAGLRLIEERWRFFWLAGDRIPTLIAGANHSGEALLRAIYRTGDTAYRIVGFLDDNHEVGSRIAEVPVLGSLEEASYLIPRYSIQEILVNSGEVPGIKMRKLVEAARQQDTRVKVLPSYQQLLDNSLKIEPRAVAIEDLLRREAVRLDMRNIRDWLDRRTVLVTGSAGSIGSEICRQLLKLARAKIILVDRSENGQFFLERELRQSHPQAKMEVCVADVCDRERLDALFRAHQPDIVFHAAAYKHVPLMEAHPGEAVKNIVLATRTLADLADEHRVLSFVMVSTDKSVNPTSVMGACKHMAEIYVQALAQQSSCRFVTVRFGNVLDSAGSVVPIFREQIASGKPVTVTHPDIQRYFMTIPEASQLVIQAGAMGEGGEIFVLDMGEPMRILDLAQDMIRLSGLREGEDIDIKITGLRPGEKLFEELYSEADKPLPTRHEKIMIARGEPCSVAEALSNISCLEQVKDAAVEDVINKLSQCVPAYGAQAPEIQHRRAA